MNFTASLLKVDYQGHASVTPTFAEKASSGPGESPVVRLGRLQLDVLDPAEVLLAVGRPENGLRSSEVVNIINTVSQHTDLVGLTVAEHLPQVEIILQRILSRLPLLQ